MSVVTVSPLDMVEVTLTTPASRSFFLTSAMMSVATPRSALMLIRRVLAVVFTYYPHRPLPSSSRVSHRSYRVRRREPSQKPL